MTDKEHRKMVKKKWRLKNAKKIAEYQKKYREKNPEKIREYYRAYRAKNPEKIAEWQKRYRSSPKGKEAHNRNMKAYYNAHKDDPEFKAKKAAYREKNREKINEYNRQRYKRLAMEKWKAQG